MRCSARSIGIALFLLLVPGANLACAAGGTSSDAAAAAEASPAAPTAAGTPAAAPAAAGAPPPPAPAGRPPAEAAAEAPASEPGAVSLLDTGYRVRERVEVATPIERTYVLLPGDYVPTHFDEFGTFYTSPDGVIERSPEGERTLPGGIHSPHPGSQGLRPMLYADFGDGKFTKIPLTREVLALYGSAIVFVHRGQEVR